MCREPVSPSRCIPTRSTTTAAGEELYKLLAKGLSHPWPAALEAITGEKQMDATAMLDYFTPLKQWLDEQKNGRKIGL